VRHLKAFHIFNVVAESASYSEAASKLCITHGAVSKQIKVLENHLALKLFYRQGRSVRLTNEGEQLKTYTQQSFQVLKAGVDKLAHIQSSSLNVSCEPTLTMRWLMPRMSSFYINNANADVRLSTAGGPIKLEADDLSLAIRRDDFELVSDYKQRPLVEEWVGPVFSPSYWQQVKNNLSEVRLLHSETRLNAWSDWTARSEKHTFLNNPQQHFAHFYFCIQAAVDGLGATIGSYPLVVDDIERGNLVAPFGFVLSGKRYILIEREAVHEHLVARKFIDWLVQEFKQCRPNQNII